MIQDKNISRKYRRDFYSPQMLSLLITAHDTAQTLDFGAGTFLAASGISVVEFADTETAKTMIPLPAHWDYDEEIGIRVIWTDSNANTSPVTWAITWGQHALGTAQGSYAALDTPMVADNHCNVDKGYNATEWGKWDANSLDPEENDFLELLITVADTTTKLPLLLGIEFCYLPSTTTGEKQAKGDFPENA